MGPGDGPARTGGGQGQGLQLGGLGVSKTCNSTGEGPGAEGSFGDDGEGALVGGGHLERIEVLRREIRIDHRCIRMRAAPTAQPRQHGRPVRRQIDGLGHDARRGEQRPVVIRTDRVAKAESSTTSRSVATDSRSRARSSCSIDNASSTGEIVDESEPFETSELQIPESLLCLGAYSTSRTDLRSPDLNLFSTQYAADPYLESLAS